MRVSACQYVIPRVFLSVCVCECVYVIVSECLSVCDKQSVSVCECVCVNVHGVCMCGVWEVCDVCGVSYESECVTLCE